MKEEADGDEKDENKGRRKRTIRWWTESKLISPDHGSGGRRGIGQGEVEIR